MRPLIPSLGAAILILGSAAAQNSGDGTSGPQLPVGQVFKQFQFPDYQNGKLQYTLFAVEAKGITLNRAEAKELKIELYDPTGAVTTTITSPDADLYVTEQKMRTKNTVQIERADMEATSQDCDFDVKAKKGLLRNHVKVILKHFDISTTPANGTTPSSTAKTPKTVSNVPMTASPAVPAPVSPQPARSNSSLLESPGSYSDPNSAPIPPSSTDTK